MTGTGKAPEESLEELKAKLDDVHKQRHEHAKKGDELYQQQLELEEKVAAHHRKGSTRE